MLNILIFEGITIPLKCNSPYLYNLKNLEYVNVCYYFPSSRTIHLLIMLQLWY
jgi:hypothetical protein